MVGNWWRLGNSGFTSAQNVPPVPEGRPDFIICVSILQDLKTWPMTTSCKLPLEHDCFWKRSSLGMPATVPCSACNTPGYVPSQSTSRSYCECATTLRVT